MQTRSEQSVAESSEISKVNRKSAQLHLSFPAVAGEKKGLFFVTCSCQCNCIIFEHIGASLSVAWLVFRSFTGPYMQLSHMHFELFNFRSNRFAQADDSSQKLAFRCSQN